MDCLRSRHISRLRPVRTGPLASLDLRDNAIRPAGALAVAEALRVHRSLQKVKLHGNDFGDDHRLACGRECSCQ